MGLSAKDEKERAEVVGNVNAKGMLSHRVGGRQGAKRSDSRKRTKS